MIANKRQRNILSFAKGLGVAALAVGLSTLITLLIPSLGEGGMYFLFLTAVIFSTLQGDIRAGAFAAFASLIANFFLLSSMNKTPKNVGDWVVLLAFGMAAGFTIFLFYIKTRLEKARIDAERRYRIIFEDAITGIYETTIDGRYTAANPKLAAILGYKSSEDLINGTENLNTGFYVEPDHRKSFISLMEKHGSVSGFESEILRFDGVKIWISENAVAVRNKAGTLIGFQGTTIEITDRKRAEAQLIKSREELESKVIERTADLEQANKILRDEMAERQRIENALRDSEEKFRTLVETSTDLIWEVDDKGVYTYLSPKVKDITGRDAEELIGKRPYDLMPPEEALRVKEKVRQVTSEGKGYMLFESVVLHKDGRLITTETSSVPIFDSDGNMRGGRGVARDITERKKTEDALRQSEEKFRALVEVSSEMIWEVDENTNYTYVSPKSQEFNGYEPHEIIGKKPFMLMPSKEAKRVAKIFKQFGENYETFYFLETITIKKDGEVTISETSGTPFFDEAGNFRGYRGVARDITARKMAAEALEESEKRYRELVENARDVIYTHDLSGRYTSLNRRGEEMFGCTREEVVNLTFQDVIAPEYWELAKQMTQAKLAGQDLTVYEIEALSRDGRRFPVEVNSWLIYDKDGRPTGVQGIARDITDRKIAENELLTSRSELRSLTAHLQSVREDERKYIARELHDEIGQKLTAVKIDLARLNTKLGKDQKLKSQDTTDNILPILSLVDDAMETTKKIVAELRPGVLDELGLEAALQWQVQEFKKRSTVICELEINFDETRLPKGAKITLFRILQECLTNITRHAKAKRVKIMLKDDAQNLLLIVEDDGTGIRLDDEKKPNSFGIVGMRERALLLGGDMMITLGADSGTRVSVIIPTGIKE